MPGLASRAVATTSLVRIVIADAHPIFRDGLRRLLETQARLRIESVMDGHYWVGNAPVSDVATSLRKFNVERRRSKAFGLTRRELEIVRVVVSGFTNKQIARQFSISESTVKRHVTHIFDKLGAS